VRKDLAKVLEQFLDYPGSPSVIVSIIKKQGGSDTLYFRSNEYFENDGVAKMNFRGKWMVMISDPTIAKNLLLQPETNPKLLFDEFMSDSAVARHFGVNVVHSNGDIWKRHRRVCNPAFKTLPIHLFVETGLKLMDILEKIDNKPVEIVNIMQRFTLDVLGKVSFNFDFNNLEDPNNVYVTAYNESQKIFKNQWLRIFPIDRIPGINQLVFRKVNRLTNLFEDIIKEKRKHLAAGQSNGDLLELMINACEDPDNQMLSDTELRNVQEKAREEVLRILGDDLTPSAEQHKSLKYLNMIIRENLRLYPPAPNTTLRRLTKDLKHKNFVIPAGTPITIFLYAIQHSPKYWENPEEFLPERFENEHANGDQYWLAFGGGSR
ncbi:322_t:CDS:10, partial [Scutellospora calospora]